MAITTDLKLTFDIEPIVKLSCFNVDCKHILLCDLDDTPGVCNLKHIHMDSAGKCAMAENYSDDK